MSDDQEESRGVPARNEEQEQMGVSGPDSTDAEAASRQAFDSMSRYLQAELEVSGSDLGLLEKLNDASIAKYEGMSRQAQDMLVHAYKIKQTYNEMKTQVAEVESLVGSVNKLEQVALELDRYSQLLEAKFQQLLK
ncbi:hypothetical protein GGF46_003004 [Coemansia sp. RSA 552]|nr:hypothetical protein GGF46_003004 [Coemansia sp. RSA 552]